MAKRSKGLGWGDKIKPKRVNWGDKIKPENLTETSEGENEVENANEVDRTPVRQRIAEMRRKLNLWEGFKFDKATEREISRVAGELVVNQLNAEKSIAIDRIINNVALSKRANLRDYLMSVSDTDKEILQIGEATKKNLSYTMQAEITQIAIDKKKWKDHSKSLLENGEIEQEDYEDLLLMHEAEALQLAASKERDRNTVSETYGKRIEQALQEYVERNPDYHKI